MIKRIVFSICAIIALSSSVYAQSGLNIVLVTDKSTIRSGEQATLKVQGYNDELSSLQWQASNDGISWKNIANATTKYFETAALTETNYFRAVTRPNKGYIARVEISNTFIIAISEETPTLAKAKK